MIHLPVYLNKIDCVLINFDWYIQPIKLFFEIVFIYIYIFTLMHNEIFILCLLRIFSLQGCKEVKALLSRGQV
jgi:hypothetical protein